MEDQLELQCPHCSSKLTIDDAGELELLEMPELAENQTRGLGGLTVDHVGPSPQEMYKQNQQIPELAQPKITFEMPKLKRAQKDSAPVIDKTSPATDAAVLKANKKDLNNRNLK